MATIIGDELMVFVWAPLTEKGFGEDAIHMNEIADQITALLWGLA